MEKLDLTKKYKSYFTAKAKPEVVDIENAQFLSISGQGDPSDKAFAQRIEALYSTAYTIKFAFKAKELDFVVSKLEGLWSYDEEKYPGKTIETATELPRSEWKYRLLIRMPDFVSREDLDNAVESVVAKKGILLAKELELFIMQEGKSVQILHVGPFSSEPESLVKIMKFMEVNNLGRNGVHHEIYLSDFRKTDPSKLKTILREPVK